MRRCTLEEVARFSGGRLVQGDPALAVERRAQFLNRNDLALRAGLFNIGAEGQLTVAGLAVGAVGAALPRVPCDRSHRTHRAGCRWRVPGAQPVSA